MYVGESASLGFRLEFVRSVGRSFVAFLLFSSNVIRAARSEERRKKREKVACFKRKYRRTSIYFASSRRSERLFKTGDKNFLKEIFRLSVFSGAKSVTSIDINSCEEISNKIDLFGHCTRAIEVS